MSSCAACFALDLGFAGGRGVAFALAACEVNSQCEIIGGSPANRSNETFQSIGVKENDAALWRMQRRQVVLFLMVWMQIICLAC